MCNVLKVSRSSYYKHLNKKPSNREVENETIKEKIKEIYEYSDKRYGAVKIYKELLDKKIRISLKRTQRLMKQLGIKSIIVKKYRPTVSKKEIIERENVLKRDFSTTGINEKWVTDITYIHTVKDGWCYLASVMDLYSRKIIGHAMSKHIDTTLALQAWRLKNISRALK
jgi:Transposase and inactivated derivatives